MAYNDVKLGANRNTGGVKSNIYFASPEDFSSIAPIETKPVSFTTYATPNLLPASSTGSAVGDYSYVTSQKQFYKVVGSTGNHVKIYPNLSIVESHVMQSGVTFSVVEAQYKSPVIEGAGSKEFQVTGKDQTLKLKVAGNIEANQSTIMDMIARPLIVIIKDNDGNLIQYGEKDAPAFLLLDKDGTGNAATDFKGAELTLACHTLAYYRGATASVLP